MSALLKQFPVTPKPLCWSYPNLGGSEKPFQINQSPSDTWKEDPECQSRENLYSGSFAMVKCWHVQNHHLIIEQIWIKILITEWMRKLEIKTTDILMSNLSWEAGKHIGKLRHRPLLHILQGVRCLGLFESQRQRHLKFLTVCVWFTCSRSHRTLEGLWWKCKFSVVHPRIWIF